MESLISLHSNSYSDIPKNGIDIDTCLKITINALTLSNPNSRREGIIGPGAILTPSY